MQASMDNLLDQPYPRFANVSAASAAIVPRAVIWSVRYPRSGRGERRDVHLRL